MASVRFSTIVEEEVVVKLVSPREHETHHLMKVRKREITKKQHKEYLTTMRASKREREGKETAKNQVSESFTYDQCSGSNCTTALHR